MKKLDILKALFIALLVIMPVIGLAQTGPITVPDVGLPRPAGGTDLQTLIVTIIQRWLLPFAGLIAVLFIIIGGFQYMFAGANPKLAEQGKATLRNAIVGLIIVILSYAIITVVVTTLFRLR